MKEALRLMSYSNRPPRTPVQQGNRIIREGNQIVKLTSQLTNGNKIKRRIGNIKDKSKG